MICIPYISFVSFFLKKIIDFLLLKIDNLEGAKIRSQLSEECLDETIEWLLHKGGQLAIYDGNNVTKKRRTFIYDKLIKSNIQPLFIEFICTDPVLIMNNILKVKVSSKDYNGWNMEDAIKDYKERIERNRIKYETIDDTLISFIKMIDAGKQLRINKVEGYLQSKIVYFLINSHIQPRTIYLARAGKSFNDISYKVDATLSKDGELYAEKLAQFIIDYRDHKMVEHENENIPESKARKLHIWTSTRRKGYQTALPFSKKNHAIFTLPGLIQLNPGECDGLTKQEIDMKYPEEISNSKKEPYYHRYPRGESYHDLAIRLESMIIALEREKSDLLIIAHETVLRCLYGYLFGLPANEIPFVSIPRTNVIEVSSTPYQSVENRLDIV
ncbi:unnamed protein product [Cunninghamella blakesleeana]